ncbi:MAG: hypothetical protein AB202_00965 [Parcubacteria bacterium C7867-007]|nr:MAG: hypothetical protein AB202_00965 [Parcubacteria bacterium C7867-007]
MTLLFISFIAGLLTVLAPCILPLLPVVVGSSAAGRSRLTPYVVVGSLAVSVILFTYLLKVSTAFITIPPYVWTIISGGVLIFFGLTLVFPALWERIPGVAKLSSEGNKLAGKGYQKKSFAGDVLIGAALGPVFSSCSPTYFVILASVLPASFALGTLYLLAYVSGLSISLLAIALLGQRFADKLSGIADPKSRVKRTIGVLFVILGLLIVTGIEKKIEAGIITSGFFDITKVEQFLLKASDGMGMENKGTAIGMLTQGEKAMRYQEVPELVSPDTYLNTGGQSINLAQYKGNSVVLVDFWTYSCINCQRTTPYLTQWHGKYKDKGLVIIGVHTPEFAFEKDKTNVEKALKEFGIEYPVILDNEYKTWNAFGNRYWPHKYLIDIDGYIVYDHIGEGEYDVTEKAIQAALAERAARLGESVDSIDSGIVSVDGVEGSRAQSPETYFGSDRNQYLSNGMSRRQGIQTLTFPTTNTLNALFLQGVWNFSPEYAVPASGARVRYTYNARDIYFVASASSPVTIKVLRDGEPVGTFAGSDVDPKTSTVTVNRDGLYKLIHDESVGVHTIELIINGDGLKAFTFTFG